MEEQEVVKALAALAQPVRLRIFRALVVTGPRGMTPGVMAEGLGVSPSVVSFHLKELTHAGLVTQERASRHLLYRAAVDRYRGCRSIVIEGDDHGLSDFAGYLGHALEFCGIR